MHWPVYKDAAVVEAGAVVQQLDGPGLQDHLQRQFWLNASQFASVSGKLYVSMRGRAHRPVHKGAAVVEAGVVVEQLDVARLQDHLQRQLLAGGQLVEQRHGLVVRRCQPGHLWEALTQQVVIVAVVHAEVALHGSKDGSQREEVKSAASQL